MTNFSFKNFFLHIVSDSKKRKEKNVMKIRIATTGRLLGIKTKVSERLEVKEPGECCTNCRRALEIASLMPEGEITIRQKDSALFMEAERCHL